MVVGNQTEIVLAHQHHHQHQHHNVPIVWQANRFNRRWSLLNTCMACANAKGDKRFMYFCTWYIEKIRSNATEKKKMGMWASVEKSHAPTSQQQFSVFPYHMVRSRVDDYSFQAVLVKEHWKQQIQLFVAQMCQ